MGGRPRLLGMLPFSSGADFLRNQQAGAFDATGSSGV